MEIILKLIFSTFLCLSLACIQYVNCSDTINTLLPITSETLKQEISESIDLSEGYLAFYKTGFTEFLGNFANCPNGLYYQGFYFRNSESAFQWAKFQLAAEHHQNLKMKNDPEMRQFFETTGEEAFMLRKKFDRKYKGVFPKNWQNGLRDEVMWQILKAKFEQNPTLAEKLAATEPLYLLEHNEKEGRDSYWSDDFTGNGFNMLGKMLMAIREGTLCPIPYHDLDRLERIHYAEDFNNKTPYHIF